MNDYIASIDAGTGGVRCVIFDAEGRAAGMDYRELTTLYTPDGRAEQDPIQLIRGAWDAVRGAILRANIDPARIAGVSAAGTQTTFVPLDGRGDFLSNIILWQDARGIEMFPSIRACLAANGMTEADLYRRTLRPLDALLAGAKLLWLRERAPDIYARVRCLANPQAVVLRALGADDITADPSDGGWWLCHDAATLAIDPGLAGMFGLNPAHFPRIVAPGTRVGSVSPDAAARTGLAAGTPLFQGSVDQCCAALGAGNAGSPDTGTLCLGTAGVCLTWSEAPVPDPLGRYYVVHYPAGGFAIERAVPVAASAFRWVRDMLYPPAAFGGDLYPRMDAEAADVPVGAGGLAFIPLMAGSVYPRMDESIRGGWIGASLGTTRGALIRSALEGICFEMRQVLEAGGRRFQSIRLLGGAARSDLWNQMQADVYGCPVETVASGEASALGAAMIAATGAGLYPELKAAVRGMTRVAKRYAPDPERAERYAALYRAWLNCVEDLAPRAFPALAAVRE